MRPGPSLRIRHQREGCHHSEIHRCSVVVISRMVIILEAQEVCRTRPCRETKQGREVCWWLYRLRVRLYVGESVICGICIYAIFTFVRFLGKCSGGIITVAVEQWHGLRSGVSDQWLQHVLRMNSDSPQWARGVDGLRNYNGDS